MQIHCGGRACRLNLGEQKRERIIYQGGERDDLKQRASERRNSEWVEGEWRDKRWSSEKWGRKAFHSYRILPFQPLFPRSSSGAHIRRCFSTLSSFVLIVGSNRGRGKGETSIFNFREIFIPVERYPFVASKKDRASSDSCEWNNAPRLGLDFLGRDRA